MRRLPPRLIVIVLLVPRVADTPAVKKTLAAILGGNYLFNSASRAARRAVFSE
jgi:hypothetical protein